MWWALQTVTTVGYGDVTPQHIFGRLVASFVMLEGIAFLAIITAAITSTFVARAAADRDASETSEELTEMARIESRLDQLDQRLDRLEAALRQFPRRLTRCQDHSHSCCSPAQWRSPSPPVSR